MKVRAILAILVFALAILVGCSGHPCKEDVADTENACRTMEVCDIGLA